MPATTRAAIPPPLPEDSPLNRDKFLFKQKVLSINERYDVIDEDGAELFFIERPRKVLRSGLAMLGALLTFLVVIVGALVAGAALDKSKPGMMGVFMIGGLVLAVALTVLVAIALSPKRHVTFFADAARTRPLLHVRQDFKLALIDARYTVHLPDGTVVGYLSKNLLTDFFRKKWRVLGADGADLAAGHEDSWFYAILRRVGGDLTAFMRTNYIVLDPSGRKLGEFNRRFTILDRYVLDLSGDPGVTLDRRLGLALGVMLDTGESR